MSDKFVTNLTEALNHARNNYRSSLSADVLAVLDRTITSLTMSGMLDHCLTVGDAVPHFTLPNIHNTPIVLKDLLAQGPVVISFYRGMWCPFCGLELQALQATLPTIQALGASLIAISPQHLRHTRATVEQYNLTFEVLSDDGNHIARQFGLTYQVPELLRPMIEEAGLRLPKSHGDEMLTLPIPGTFVVDRQGIVLHAFVDPDYTYRLDPLKIVSVLRKQS